MAAIADRLIAKVEIRLGGRDWPLVVTHEVLLECERLTGKKMLAGGEVLRPSARLAQTLLFLLLRRAGASYALQQVGQLFTPSSADRIQAKILEAWIASMPEAATDRGEGGSSRNKPVESIEAWAIARYDLGLSDQEWLDSTPRQIDELLKRKRQRLQHEEWLMAVLAAETRNAPHWRYAKPNVARDFMTMYPLPDPEPMTGIGMVRAAFARFPKKKAA